MRILQCYFSEAMGFFKEDFKKRWSLSDYTDENQPALFFGLYTKADVEAVNNHKGFKLIFICGVDSKNLPLVGNVPLAAFSWDYENSYKRYLGESQYPLLDKRVPVKSYDDFKPVPLGDKIYIYLGQSSNINSNRYFYNSRKAIEKYFGENVIVTLHDDSLENVRDNIYPQTLVNINLNPFGGLSTAMELAHMGRRSISQRPEAFCVGYDTTKGILYRIRKEMDRIGQTRHDVAYDVKESIMTEDYWLQTEYYE